MRRLLLALPLLLLPACGSGTIRDIFSAFPPEAFEPGDGGGGLPPGPFTPSEVAVLGGGQGVSGDVRNVAVAQVGGETFAFLAAGIDGCHVVNVTEPDILNSADFVITIRDARLDAPNVIAGGRVDAIAVVDNTFLVLLAVGTAAPNAVTVLNIATLIELATGPTANLTGALIPLAAGATGIPAGGRAGKAGGVAGGQGRFFVATGGPTLGVGTITPAPPPGEWSESAAFDPGPPAGGPEVENFLDVTVTPLAVIASVQNAGVFGILSVTNSAPPTLVTPGIIDVADDDDDFDVVADDFISGPGNHPLDLASDDIQNVFVSGDGDVKVFSVNLQAQNPIEGTGMDTIAVDATPGVVAVGAGDVVRVYTVAGGAARVVATVSFPGTVTVRGVALLTTDQGSFVLCAGGTTGLRVVQWAAGTGGGS